MPLDEVITLSANSRLRLYGWSDQEVPPLSTPARVSRIDGTTIRVMTVDGPLAIRNTRNLDLTVGDWIALDEGYRWHIRAVLRRATDGDRTDAEYSDERTNAEPGARPEPAPHAVAIAAG